jgi:hypothetical protein
MNASTAPERADEIDRYIAGVSAALADLPDKVRQDLLDDLPQHLAEIAADDPASLDSRLGSPPVYAAELRAAAGVDVSKRQRRARELASAVATLRPYLTTIDARTGQFLGYERFVDFLMLLRPAWWVIRGYAVALIVIMIFVGNTGLLPDADGAGILGWLFVLLLIGVSIRIGRHPLRLPAWARPVWTGAGVVLMIVILYGVAVADHVDSNYYDSGPGYNDRSEVYIYNDSGQPITDVRVYDRDGNPVPVGVPLGCESTQQPWHERRGCLPFIEPTTDSDPSRSGGPSRTPYPGPVPSRSPDPGASLTPSASGGPDPGSTGSPAQGRGTAPSPGG